MGGFVLLLILLPLGVECRNERELDSVSSEKEASDLRFEVRQLGVVCCPKFGLAIPCGLVDIRLEMMKPRVNCQDALNDSQNSYEKLQETKNLLLDAGEKAEKEHVEVKRLLNQCRLDLIVEKGVSSGLRKEAKKVAAAQELKEAGHGPVLDSLQGRGGHGTCVCTVAKCEGVIDCQAEKDAACEEKEAEKVALQNEVGAAQQGVTLMESAVSNLQVEAASASAQFRAMWLSYLETNGTLARCKSDNIRLGEYYAMYRDIVLPDCEGLLSSARATEMVARFAVEACNRLEMVRRGLELSKNSK